MHIESSEDGKKKSTLGLDATAGAIAGCISRVVVGPLDVVKIRFQVQIEPIVNGQISKAVASKYTGFGQALWAILKEEGVQVGATHSLPTVSEDLRMDT